MEEEELLFESHLALRVAAAMCCCQAGTRGPHRRHFRSFLLMSTAVLRGVLSIYKRRLAMERAGCDDRKLYVMEGEMAGADVSRKTR